MTQTHALVAICTAASLLIVFLLLLRAEFGGRRPVLALARRWAAAKFHTTAIVLAALFAVAVSAFALLPLRQPIAPASAAIAGHEQLADEDDDVAALRNYATNIDAPSPEPAVPGKQDLPGVDDMIAKLVARLEQQPGDVKGWKMLGWSYLNTGRPDEAVKAYEAALKLAPEDSDIKAALAAARPERTSTAKP
jgi:tetratricopeptide (TPR) repeat protein